MKRTLFLLMSAASSAWPQVLGEDPLTLIRLIRKAPGDPGGPSVIYRHRTARVPVDVIGLNAITGVGQVWLIEAHGSFASLEATVKALSVLPPAVENLFDGATLIGLLRPALSYRPEDAIKSMPSARYFQATFFRTRPGASFDFAEVMRIRNAAYDSLNVERPELGYQIVSGGESGMYVFLAPMQSLAIIDNALARTWASRDGTGQAIRQSTNRITSEAEIVREQLLFRVDPANSHVSESFAAAAPDFWKWTR